MSTAFVDIAYSDRGSWVDAKDRALKFGPNKPGYNTHSCKAACPDYKFFALGKDGTCTCDNKMSQLKKQGKKDCSKLGGTKCAFAYEINPNHHVTKNHFIKLRDSMSSANEWFIWDEASGTIRSLFNKEDQMSFEDNMPREARNNFMTLPYTMTTKNDKF